MPANALERALSVIAPGVAVRRARDRARLRRLESSGGRGGYEGASKGRRTDRWLAQGTDANASLAGALPSLRNRSRDLVRNNAWAANGVATIEAWTVGAGIMAQPVGKGAGVDRVAEIWKSWAHSTECDADGIHDLAGLQRLCTRTMVESGSVLIRRRIRRDSDDLTVPLQLQVLEPDHLDLTRRYASGSGAAGQQGNRVTHGVEFDALGRRVAYWLYPEHPGSDQPRRSLVSKRVPAIEILHLFRQSRPGQVLGVPWLTPALIRLRNLDEFEDGELLRMTIASSWAAFVTQEGDPDQNDGNPLEPIEDIAPGAVEYLAPGQRIEFPTLPQVAGLDAYTSTQLRAIAAALEVPYEALTGDLQKVNFSSGRMGFNAFERRVLLWQGLLKRQMLTPVWEWFLEAAVAAELPANARDLEAIWTPPARMILDPEKEGQAMYEAVRNGRMTVSEMLRASGKDPRQHLQEMADDLDLLEELELPLDCNVRTSGQPGAAPQEGEDGEASEEHDADDAEESNDDSNDDD